MGLFIWHLPKLTGVLNVFRSTCRFFYASSACIYPEGRQLNTEVEGGGLREDDAWPAQVKLVPFIPHLLQ